jgi:major membrane immunogen (membrane-anchored lipoprotein)
MLYLVDSLTGACVGNGNFQLRLGMKLLQVAQRQVCAIET